jgi:hypothetical protein
VPANGSVNTALSIFSHHSHGPWVYALVLLDAVTHEYKKNGKGFIARKTKKRKEVFRASSRNYTVEHYTMGSATFSVVGK